MGISKEIFFISGTVAFVYTGLTMIFPILPFYLELFGGGATEFGWAASAFALAILIFSPPIGRLADKIGKTRIITFSLIGYGFTNFLFIFVTNYWQIISLRFLEGIFTGGVAPAAISIASDLSHEKNRARSIAFVTAGISFGVIVGPLIGGTLIEYFPLWTPFILSGCLGLSASVFSNHLLVEPKTSEMYQDAELNYSKWDIRRFIDIVPKPIYVFIVFLVIQFIVSLSWMIIEPGFVFYFYNELNYSSTQFGIFVAVYGFFVFVGEVVLGGISDTFGRKIIIFIGSLIHGLFYWYLSIATGFVNLVIAAAVAGIALGLIGPALNALLSEVADPEKRTYIFGISTSISGMAQIIGPLTGGWAIDQSGISISHIALFSSGIVFFSAILVIFLNFSTEARKEYLDHEINLYPEISNISD